MNSRSFASRRRITAVRPESAASTWPAQRRECWTRIVLPFPMTKLDLAYSRSHRSRRLRQQNLVSFPSWPVEVALACRRPPPPHGCSPFPSLKLRAHTPDQSRGGVVSFGPVSDLSYSGGS